MRFLSEETLQSDRSTWSLNPHVVPGPRHIASGESSLPTLSSLQPGDRLLHPDGSFSTAVELHRRSTGLGLPRIWVQSPALSRAGKAGTPPIRAAVDVWGVRRPRGDGPDVQRPWSSLPSEPSETSTSRFGESRVRTARRFRLRAPEVRTAAGVSGV